MSSNPKVREKSLQLSLDLKIEDVPTFEKLVPHLLKRNELNPILYYVEVDASLLPFSQLVFPATHFDRLFFEAVAKNGEMGVSFFLKYSDATPSSITVSFISGENRLEFGINKEKAFQKPSGDCHSGLAGNYRKHLEDLKLIPIDYVIGSSNVGIGKGKVRTNVTLESKKELPVGFRGLGVTVDGYLTVRFQGCIDAPTNELGGPSRSVYKFDGKH